MKYDDKYATSTGYATTDYADSTSFDSPRQNGAGSTDFADAIENRFYHNTGASQTVGRTAQPYRATSAAPSSSASSFYASRETAPRETSARETASSFDSLEEERNFNLHNRYTETAPAPERKEGMTYTTAVDPNPTETTLQYQATRMALETADEPLNHYENFHAKGETKLEKQYTINAKGKILIAVYALVVITVFALIILNTRLLKSMNSNIREKQAQVQDLTEQVRNLNAQLDYVSSDEVIIEKATEMGWSKN